MPSERFYKLPIQKRARIKNAVVNEFCTVPIEHVSLQKVAENAGISRGSLYTYFENKQDALVYVLSETQGILWENFKSKLLQEGGDFWSAMRKSFRFNMNYCQEHHLYCILRYACIKPEYIPISYRDVRRILDAKNWEELFEWTYQHTDKRHFHLNSREDFFTFLEICFSLMIMSLQEYAKGAANAETIEASFWKKLHHLMLGVYQ